MHQFNMLQHISYPISYLGFIIFLLLNLPVEGFSNPVIHEILATSSIDDEFGNPLEWIELYNPTDQSIDLTNYSLTDDLLAPGKWRFPNISLPPKDYLLIYTSGYDFYNPGEYHTNFRLDADGETIALFDADLKQLDKLTIPPQIEDISYGRELENPEEWSYFSDPTPERANTSEKAIVQSLLPEVVPPGGLYDEPVTVTITTKDERFQIRYTLDGSEPTQSSPRYESPIQIAHTTPLRTRLFRSGYTPSRIVTHTYFNEDRYPLPVVSFVTEPDNLWDRSTGIYANATRSGVQWERPTSAEFYHHENETTFNVDAGLRIHGGASRQRAEKKSFRLYFRNEYGPGMLHADLIPSTSVNVFDSFVFRAGYNDSWVHWDAKEREVAGYFSDQLARDIHSDMGFVSSHGIYVNLYLNGDYWGIYNLCERIDGEYLASYYGFPEWDIINDDELKEGDTKEWNTLRNFVNRTNFSNDENYNQLLTMIDLPQVTSYYIINIWMQNHDWPHHNWYAVRERHAQGKWKFILWDIEDSLGSGASRGQYGLNTFSRARGNGFLGDLFDNLLENESYQRYFIDRFEYYMNHELSPSHLLQRLNDHTKVLRPAILMEAERWNKTKDMEDWEGAIQVAKDFIQNRTEIIRRYIYTALRIPTPTPTPIGPQPTATPTPFGFDPTPTPTQFVPTSTPTPTPIPPGEAVGIFDGHRDIGNVLAVGNATYDPTNQVYTVTGSGTDIWGSNDEFHFVYKQLSGDFQLEAKIGAENFGNSNWAKILLMARETLTPQAKHFAPRIQESNFQLSSQWRLETGANADSTPGTARINSIRHDGRLRLQREGDRFETFYFDIPENQWVFVDGQTTHMDDPIYIGLAVTSHDNGNYALGTFSEVKLESPNVSIWNWLMHY